MQEHQIRMKALGNSNNKVFKQILKKYDILNDEPRQVKPDDDKKGKGFQNVDQE